jgi:hypothetical protein
MTGPEDAYKYAKGETIKHPLGYNIHGYLNGMAMARPGLGAPSLFGIAAAVFALVALAASFVVPLRAAWTRVVVRVAGSWIAAIGFSCSAGGFARVPSATDREHALR